MQFYDIGTHYSGFVPVQPLVRRDHHALYHEWARPPRPGTPPRTAEASAIPRGVTPAGDVRLALAPTLALHLAQFSTERS
jgi:hypothetical protein